MINAVFFDLYFTLADLEYQQENEFTTLGISRRQWKSSAENPQVYIHRASGKAKTEEEMIDAMVAGLPFEVSASQKQKLVDIRNDRYKKSLTMIQPAILSTLEKLKAEGIRLCLISNADIIDKKYWDISPLKNLFDIAIFSCDLGIVKPDEKIYQLAMDSFGVTADCSIFIGDGGSDELAGAKAVGIATVLTEYLTVKPAEQRERIVKSADYVVSDFKDIYNIIKEI